MSFNPTEEQRNNLAKLADYLDALPADYDRFNMSAYMLGADGYSTSPLRQAEPNVCGSCACAIGHGPAAGIGLRGDPSWPEYAERVFGTDEAATSAGEYMFGVDNPNDPRAAADRIRKVLSGEWQA